MEKQTATNYDGAQTTGVRVNDSGADGLNRDQAYDSGFKYQIPEAGQRDNSEPSYQSHGAVGADSKFQLFRTSQINGFSQDRTTNRTPNHRWRYRREPRRLGKGSFRRGPCTCGINSNQADSPDNADITRAPASGCVEDSTLQSTAPLAPTKGQPGTTPSRAQARSRSDRASLAAIPTQISNETIE